MSSKNLKYIVNVKERRTGDCFQGVTAKSDIVKAEACGKFLLFPFSSGVRPMVKVKTV